MTGVNLQRYDSDPIIQHVVDRMIDEGHAIGNHAYSHTKYLHNQAGLLQELQQTNALITDVYAKHNLSIPQANIPIRLPYLQYFGGLDWVQDQLGINYFVRGYLGTDYNEAAAGKATILHQYYTHLAPGQIFVCHTRAYAQVWLGDLIEKLQAQTYTFANFRQDQSAYYQNYGKLVY